MAYTIEELIAARGTTEPVRQALIAKALEADELRAENERLREALEGLLHMWSSRNVEAARAALGDTK